MPTLDPHIFRAYDIRGRAHHQIDARVCTLIGRAFGSILRERYKIEHPTVVVGRDARTHGKEFEVATSKGLQSAGCHVKSIGQTPTPVNYFILAEKGFDASVQVTASHNPKEDNGLKLQVRGAEAFSGEDIQILRRRIEAQDFLSGTGSFEEIEAIEPYSQQLVKRFAGAGKGLTVAIDNGNGITGPVYNHILQDIGCQVIELYSDPDGTFPNHIADPSKRATLTVLQETVREKRASLGLAFDGDGDRVGFIDETGAIRSADEILLLLARDHLERHPGAPIVFTVSNSNTLETEIRKWGGKPIMCKVGHSFVEHAMREYGSLLGGEQSGHYFLGEFTAGYDDALVAALQVLVIFSNEKLKMKKGKSAFSSLFTDFPKVFQAPELRPHCPDSEKSRIVKAITDHFKKSYPVNDLDGARIDFGESAWAGVRQSNTSPCLSLCIEARSEAKLKEVKEIVLDHLRTYPVINLAS
ncbi:MAG: phosphomannomutase/phosphoglucomutase [Candidatus Peribacteraceae bacterium]|nr:phosphomannomutase/phosphoglucomutase [Candidatus Peribacteraceae bacterium]